MEFVEKNYVGFKALEVNCSGCPHLSSLKDTNCINCINSLNKEFDLLELRKSFSTIYFEKGLSSSLKNDNFHIFKPYIVPLFINYYIIPPKEEVEVPELLRYSIEVEGGIKKINFLPKEYFLSIEDLKLFDEYVKKIQNEEISIEKIDELVPEDKQYLRRLIRNYTYGLGIVEEILTLPFVQDLYINSPGSSRIFINHSKEGQLITNIVLKEEFLNKIGTNLRTNSGRPFDEAFPVIHTMISSTNSRVCGITVPLSFNGSGFAIRKHNTKPLTLFDLIEKKFLSSEVMAFLWFLLDNQVSILVTGPRGAGKTTLLGALILHINRNNRFIVIEDTAELPSEFMRNNNFNIEHLRTSSIDSDDTYELSNDMALRTALRLGESVLVVGEVRGSEAKMLFEAMRVGAAGNSVLGTIHGSDAFDTFDRIVNDLGIPPTSFKATDIVISCSYLNIDGKRERRLTGITEIKKDWIKNPSKEKGFYDLFTYNPKRKKYKKGDLSKSQLIKKIAYKRAMSMKEIEKELKERKKIIDLIMKNIDNIGLKEEMKVIDLINNRVNNLEKKIREIVNTQTVAKNIILDELHLAGATSARKAIPTKELYERVSSRVSRRSFNKMLISLSEKKMIGSIDKDGTLYWYLLPKRYLTKR